MALTNVLLTEHAQIERLIRLLDITADRDRQGQPLQPSFFVEAARFIRVYAGGIQHTKKDGILFPVIESGMKKALDAQLK